MVAEVIAVTGLTNLETLEKETFRKFYEDGLFDVVLGLMMTTMAIGAVVTDWIGSEGFGLLIMVGAAFVLVAALLVMRHRLLRSRLGEFQPGPRRRRRIRATRLALLASVVVGLIVFAVAAIVYASGVSVASLEVVIPVVWFVNATVVLGAMAHFLDVPRFYVYGLLFGLGMPLLIWPDLLWDVRVSPLVAFTVPAAPIVATGLYKLARFLRDYPVLPAGDGESADGGP